MARRNRPRVVWFPNANDFSVDALSTRNSTFQTFQHDVIAVNRGEGVVSLMPCIADQPADPINDNSSLADLESSGYRLRRIVGKIWVQALQVGEDVGPLLVGVTVGFIILRTDAVGVPIGSSVVDDYSPAIIDTNDNPWIWRRSWLLGNAENNLPAAATQGIFQVGGSNCGLLGGNMDGPHVDAKTARLVGKDERLFMVASSVALKLGVGNGQTSIEFFTDLRVLGSMRSSVGNRRNASR